MRMKFNKIKGELLAVALFIAFIAAYLGMGLIGLSFITGLEVLFKRVEESRFWWVVLFVPLTFFGLFLFVMIGGIRSGLRKMGKRR